MNAFSAAADAAHRWDGLYEPLPNFMDVKRKIGHDVQFFKLNFPASGIIRTSLYEVMEHMQIWLDESVDVQNWSTNGQIESTDTILHNACDELIYSNSYFKVSFREAKTFYDKKIDEEVENPGSVKRELDEADKQEKRKRKETGSGFHTSI